MVDWRLCSRHRSERNADRAAEKLEKKGIKTKVSRLVTTNVWCVNVPTGTPYSVCSTKRRKK